MKYRTRIYYSEAQKSLMWEHWRKGDSLHDIARLFDRGHASIQRIIGESGGIRPRQRKRANIALSLSERESISRGIAADLSIRSIAKQSQRSPSTISREINRNGGYYEYRAVAADQAAWDRSQRPKCRFAAKIDPNLLNICI